MLSNKRCLAISPAIYSCSVIVVSFAEILASGFLLNYSTICSSKISGFSLIVLIKASSSLSRLSAFSPDRAK